MAEREAEYDRRVAQRIRRGETMSAADYIDLVAARRGWIARMVDALRPFDALLSPTVPVVAPPLAPLVDDDEAFFVPTTFSCATRAASTSSTVAP